MARTLAISAEQPPDATRTAAGQLVTPEYDGLPVAVRAAGRPRRRGHGAVSLRGRCPIRRTLT